MSVREMSVRTIVACAKGSDASPKTVTELVARGVSVELLPGGISGYEKYLNHDRSKERPTPEQVSFYKALQSALDAGMEIQVILVCAANQLPAYPRAVQELAGVAALLPKDLVIEYLPKGGSSWETHIATGRRDLAEAVSSIPMEASSSQVETPRKASTWLAEARRHEQRQRRSNLNGDGTKFYTRNGD